LRVLSNVGRFFTFAKKKKKKKKRRRFALKYKVELSQLWFHTQIWFLQARTTSSYSGTRPALVLSLACLGEG
jgi:hypothetical protein